jgi:hypothetical protein
VSVSIRLHPSRIRNRLGKAVEAGETMTRLKYAGIAGFLLGGFACAGPILYTIGPDAGFVPRVVTLRSAHLRRCSHSFLGTREYDHLFHGSRSIQEQF